MTLYANSKIATEIATAPSAINFAGMADDPTRVQYMIDLLSAETADGTDQVNRAYMDEMSPICRISVVAALTKLKANVT